MPRGDGSGPMGMGSMTGRGAGYCAGNTAPGFASAGYGFGRGGRCRGFAGGGYGRRNMFYATGQPGWARFGGMNAPISDPDQEANNLKKQAEWLGEELARINSRLETLEGKTTRE